MQQGLRRLSAGTWSGDPDNNDVVLERLELWPVV